MTVNKPSGNMYPWAYTWNPLAGECRHKCSYCYREPLKRTYNAIDKKYSGKPRLIEKELSKIASIPSGYKIFVCSMTDLFASDVPSNIIRRILAHCRKYPNPYLFQTKNPRRFHDFIGEFPWDTVLGTTIETNRMELIDSQAPNPEERYLAIKDLPFLKMISLEPVMDFDLDVMFRWMRGIKPEFLSIGADSKASNLSEPMALKISQLLRLLEEANIRVRCKSNLLRIVEDLVVK